MIWLSIILLEQVGVVSVSEAVKIADDNNLILVNFLSHTLLPVLFL
jgi:translation initiation factor IF-3